MEELTFDSFHAGSNRILVDALEVISRGGNPGAMLYFWGPAGSGKSHLLQASCSGARDSGRPCLFLVGDDEYLSGGMERAPWPEPEPGSLVCIDDLGIGSVDPELELNWLSLYELLRQGGGNLVVAASKPPAGLGLSSQDLVSRLTAGGVFHLSAVGDVEKRQILAERAMQRGFELPEQVIEYIMRHHARDPASLFRLLDRLDHASLSQHRRITIPFLRELLGG
jgi:DnaA family protein